MELNEMNDKEIALRIAAYIKRAYSLMNDISKYINENRSVALSETVHNEYMMLKREIRDDDHYVNLERNKKPDETQAYRTFRNSISEANAYGFTSRYNSVINNNYFSSVEEAHYKLTKWYNLDRWENIANERE